MVKLASDQTPRTRATETERMASDPTLMVSNETLANFWRVPISKNSVL